LLPKPLLGAPEPLYQVAQVVEIAGMPPGMPAALQSIAHSAGEEKLPKEHAPLPEVGFRIPDQA